MKKPTRPHKSSPGKTTGTDTGAAGARKASRLKPLKSKEIKRSKNPRDFEEDGDDFLSDDDLNDFESFQSDERVDDDDDF